MSENTQIEIGVYPLRGTLYAPEIVELPGAALIMRAGINPADGQPAFWYRFNVVDGKPMYGPSKHKIVVTTTGHRVPHPANHIGMWWAASETFHMFELFEPGGVGDEDEGPPGPARN